MSPTPKQVCSLSGIKWRTSTFSGWLSQRHVTSSCLLLKVQKFHGGVDNRGTGIVFPLKNQRNTTKDQLASPYGSFLTQLQEWFSSDNQCVALGQSLVPKCVERHPTVFRAHKGIGRTLPGWPTVTTKPQYGNVMLGSKVGQPQGCGAEQASWCYFFSVTATLSQHCHTAEDCLHSSCYQLILWGCISGYKWLKTYLSSTMG